MFAIFSEKFPGFVVLLLTLFKDQFFTIYDSNCRYYK